MEQKKQADMEIRDNSMLERYFTLHHGINFTKDELNTIIAYARQELIFAETGEKPAEQVLDDKMKISSGMPLSPLQRHHVILAMKEYAFQFKPEYRVRETGAMPNLQWFIDLCGKIKQKFRKKPIIDMDKYADMEQKYS